MQSIERYFPSFATRRDIDNQKRDTFHFSGGLTRELLGIRRNAPYILEFYQKTNTPYIKERREQLLKDGCNMIVSAIIHKVVGSVLIYDSWFC